MKRLVLGILAHVDAGKTTLAEAMLFVGGAIRKQGRVDRRDSFLDTHELERERGITIFSQQARIELPGCALTLLDTPGHSDFSSETERAVQAMDYAVLVISGTDGVQAHTETVWKLLRRCGKPVFIFVSKMDLAEGRRSELMRDIKDRLDSACIDFGAPPEKVGESVAECSEQALDAYLAHGVVPAGLTAALIKQRRVFPCFFGSGLRLTGVEEFLKALDELTVDTPGGPVFGARVFKISRDSRGARMTFMKITGGSLRVRSPIRYTADGETLEEKAAQIRIYSGAGFTQTDEAHCGEICAVLGLTATRPGMGLGEDADSAPALLEPVLTYSVSSPARDAHTLLEKLRLLEEEDPQLSVSYSSQTGDISLRVMGPVQLEILTRLMNDRFGLPVEFGGGRVMYKETIAAPSHGAGHFEPLRHYAEVHLLLEPLERGAGLEFRSLCSEDELAGNWQRLILSQLEEPPLTGVMTGSPVTDMRVTLIAGRAHLKHTEGSDFRQAARRAFRQGLMKTESVLLEPYYEFRIELPVRLLGRAINDIRGMHGRFSSDEGDGEFASLSGLAPVKAMRDYYRTLLSYTHGLGRMSLTPSGYEPCFDSDAAAAEIGYEPLRDTENPADSVFCSHGAGTSVPWDKADGFMHVDPGLDREAGPDNASPPPHRLNRRNFSLDDRELEEIMEREFGPIRRRSYAPRVYASDAVYAADQSAKKDYLIVDGYNMIFSWKELRQFDGDLDAARLRLMELLSNYRAFRGSELVLVFDAYKVKGGGGERFDYHGIHVLYTREGETGDMYIERLASEIGKNYNVRVSSSDGLIRLSAMRAGLLRISAQELESEVSAVYDRIRGVINR
ncbi:MAG: TetM/TetW/TetO/TetS family tetracycline resistance ribosomal protection protein [Oscillospiraceae bacterium]|nr:TetM/TetW/TetO/TetS family tetracycline resistance ribosomal protection protein [Oscillospiraceae bacterium]